MATLEQASFDQYIACTALNFEAWGTRLTLQQHIDREKMLLKSNFSRSHKPYVLVDEGNVVASFETYETPCFYCTDGNEVKRGSGVSIASVFVEERYRGKGYASTMLSLFNKQAREKGYVFSDLYSDVKPAIYERVGWKEYPAPNVAVHVANFCKSSHFDTNGATIFEDGEIVNQLIQSDEKLTREDVQEKAKLFGANTAVFSHILTHAKIEWLALVAKYYATILNYESPTRWGAKIDDENFIFWSHDFREMELLVLKLRSTSPQHTQKLISAAVSEAQKYAFSHVNIWWNLPDTHAATLDLTIKNRVNSSIPMLSWFSGDQKVEWINVEKYGWV
eukprot:Phypoly_transcript_14113.p1 GENE.Phypoly_transcript_14113~~Phypoly_transcript_14113.p1  ORF type:complete len:335 (+),score=49.35 Phypoly_transcript_14113:1-1005(+)